MASIRKRGSSYLIVVSMGYDYNGKRIKPQRREDAFDVLPVTADGGLGQLARSDVRQPQVDVFCQRELLDGREHQVRNLLQAHHRHRNAAG